jgi:hypothetical protein
LGLIYCLEVASPKPSPCALGNVSEGAGIALLIN